MCFKGDEEYGDIAPTATKLLGFNRDQMELFWYRHGTGFDFHPTVEEIVQRTADLTGLEFKIDQNPKSLSISAFWL